MVNTAVVFKLAVDGASSVTSAFDKVSQSIAGATGPAGLLKNALGGIAGAMSVGAAMAWAKSTIDAADAMNDLSQRVGIAVKDLAKYELAANQSGTSMEAIAKGVKGLAGNLMEHGEALKKAGINATTADGAMQQLADVFASMPDGLEKTTLAVKMFGKSGMDLIPMLNLGSAGLAEAAEKSAQFGAQMAAMAPIADAFNDNMAELSLAGKTAGMTFTNELLPTLIKISEALIDSKNDAGGFAEVFGKVVNTSIETAALLISDVVFVLKGMGREIGAISAQAVALASLDFKGASAIGDAVTQDAQRARAELDKFQAALVSARALAAKPIPTTYAQHSGVGYKAPANAKTLLGALGGSDDSAKKALADVNRELDAQAKLLADLAGLSGSFAQDWDRLSALYKSNKIDLQALTAAQAKLLEKQPALQAAAKAHEEASKEAAKADILAFKAMDDLRVASEKQLVTAAEMLSQIEFETRLLDLNTEARAIATLERDLELQGIVKGTAAYDDYIAKLREAMAIKTGKEAGIKAADDMREAQQKAAEESSKYWEDALMRAFERGNGFFESLWDTIKNTLKTQALKVQIAPVTSALSGVASAALGTSSGLNSVTQAASLASAAASLDSAVMLLGSPVGIAIAAALALDSLGAFGSKFVSAADSGRARVDYTAAGIGAAAYNTTGDTTQITAAQKSVETLAQSYFKTAAALGINAMQATFEFGSNTGREGAAPQTVLGVNIGKAAYSSGEIASGDAAGLQLAASRAIITALKASEMPAYLSKVFDGLTVSTATQDQISAALQYAGSLKTIRDALLETREPLQIVKDNVASAFATLGTSAETFKADFVAAIDAGITGDALIAWQALGAGLDQVTASAKESARATAEWQTKIDIAAGKTTQREVEKAAALATADTATAKLIKEFYALEDAAKAAEHVKTMNAAIADTSTVIRDFYTMLADKAAALKQTLQGWKDTYAPPDPATLAERIAEGINNSGATENISATELLNMSVADLNAWAAEVSQLTVPETVTSGILNGDALRGAIANAVAGAYTANTAGFDASATTPGELAKLLAPSIASAFKAMGVDDATSTSSATSVAGMLGSSFASTKAGWGASSGIDTVPEAATDWINKTLGGINDIALTDTVLKPIFDTVQADVNALIGQIQAKENYVDPGSATSGIDKAASEKISLQNQLNALTDTSVQALKRQRDALDESNWALFDQVQVAQKAKAVSDEQKSLQDQLNALTDTATQALTRQRDALDESNRATFDQMQAAQKAKTVSQEQKTLQDQINALTDTSTQALNRQRDALDESNRTLFDQVQLAQKSKAVADEKLGLQDQLDQLTMTSTALLEKQRMALDASNQGLFDSIQLEKEKQRQVEVNNSKLSLQAQIFELTGDKVGALAVKEQQRTLELDKLDPSLRQWQTTLWELQDAAASASTAVADVSNALDGYKSATDAAYSALQNAVDAQKSVVQETISNVSAIIDSIDSAVRSIRGEADSAGTFDRAQSFLDNALSNAQASGYLPDSKELSAAIADLTSGLSSQIYASEADKQFQALAVAGKLDALGGLAKPQLSAAQQQLKVLDDTLTTAKNQIDELRGINDSVLGIGGAISRLAAAIEAEKAGGAALATSTQTTLRPINPLVTANIIDYQDDYTARNAVALAGGADAVRARILAMYDGRFSEPLDTVQQLATAAKIAGMRGFKTGTNYVTADGPYYLHEGEEVTPKAYNSAAGGQQNNNARMESLIEGLTKEVQRLQSIVNDGNRHAERTADATNGRPEQPMLVETV